MEFVYIILAAVGFGGAFLIGLNTGRRHQPQPDFPQFTQTTYAVSTSSDEVITLDKPADNDVEAIAELVQKVIDAIDILNGPPTGWNSLPYNQRIPLDVGQTTVHVEWSDPDEDYDWTAKLFWNGEELLLDDDEQYELNNAIDDWNYQVEEWVEGEGRRKANELAQQVLASS